MYLRFIGTLLRESRFSFVKARQILFITVVFLFTKVAERHDIILKQKSDLAILDDKHRDAVAQVFGQTSLL